MNTNFKRFLAIAFAFAIGLLLSSKVNAQSPQQLQRMESTIARLEAELAELKAQAARQSETAFPPTIIDPAINGSSSRNIIEPGFETQQRLPAPRIELPTDPAFGQVELSPASQAPTLTPQSTFQQIPQIAPLVAPSVLQSPTLQPQTILPRPLSPTYLQPVVPTYEICPLSGRVYSVQRPAYLQHRIPPLQYREWDYLDEHYYGR